MLSLVHSESGSKILSGLQSFNGDIKARRSESVIHSVLSCAWIDVSLAGG